MDLNVGDTVYRVVYANDSEYPLRVEKERVTALEGTYSGYVMKTAKENEVPGRGYFIDMYYIGGPYADYNGCTIWWDKNGLRQFINECLLECQKRFDEMIAKINDMDKISFNYDKDGNKVQDER